MSVIYCNSWIITDKKGNAIFETYNKKIANKINKKKYNVYTAYDYLVMFNKKIEFLDRVFNEKTTNQAND